MSLRVTHSQELEDYGVHVRKLESSETGLQVCLVDTKDLTSGVVNGFFVLATEAHDDFGLPHTLEHLVFLGSEKYPYKGVLDSLANLALAQGTNAWTDVDHTAYTLTTAGSEGFLRMLPIYLDHILYPTLTDSGFVTEVHHVNGDGQNSGVVYAEMQARENTEFSLTYRRLMQKLYEGTGYASETGGIMADIRRMNNQQIRDYHKSFYRPDNLCVIITGAIDMDKTVVALEDIDRSIAAKGSLPPMPTKPWSSDVGRLKQTISELVVFPADDERSGTLWLSWHGPEFRDRLNYMAMDMIWEYLTDTAVAPLQKKFLKCENPLAADIQTHIAENSLTAMMVVFKDVVKDRLDGAEREIVEYLATALDEAFDLDRMHDMIKKRIQKELAEVEADPGEKYAMEMISDFLYGRGDEAVLHSILCPTENMTRLLNWSADDWRDFYKQWFISKPHICVRGSPSVEFSKKLNKEEEERIERQKVELGEDGLKKKASELEAAEEANDVDVPDEIMKSFQTPGTDGIAFIPITTYQNTTPVKEANGDNNATSLILRKEDDDIVSRPLPFFLQFDSVKSKFATVVAFIETKDLNEEERMMLELYLEAMFETPIERDGALIDADTVVKEINRDIVSHSNGIGVAGGSQSFSTGRFASLVTIRLKVEEEKYSLGVRWMHEILNCAVYDTKRLNIAAQQLLKEANSAQREASKMARALLSEVSYGSDSTKLNTAATNVVRQFRFLTKVVADLEMDGAKMEEKFRTFLQKVTATENLAFQVVANLETLKEPLTTWHKVFGAADDEGVGPKPIDTVLYRRDPNPACLSEGMKGAVIGLGSTESSYLFVTGNGPSSFDDPDVPALKVLTEVLDAMEGVFWRSIRGKGLSYGHGFSVNPESGNITYMLYRSTNLKGAFKESLSIIKQLAEDEEFRDNVFDEDGLRGAISTRIYQIVQSEDTMAAAAINSFMKLNLTKLGPDATIKNLQATQRVTLDDLLAMFNKYIQPMFEWNDATRVSVTTGKAKVNEVVKMFREDFGLSLMGVEDPDTFFV
eukprot:Clim_evm60s55 gene=Clim_evmTU60s55